MSEIILLPLYLNLLIGSQNHLSDFRIEDCYRFTYEQLVRKFGEVQTLEIVYHFQCLSESLSHCFNHYIHTCELLTTFSKCKNAEQTFFNRQCSVSRLPNTSSGKHKAWSFLQILELIKGQELAHMTAQLRRLTNGKEKEHYLINNFPLAYFPLTFITRFYSKVVGYGGLICIQMDGLGEHLGPIRDLVNSLPLVVASFSGPDGNGLRVIFEMKPENLSHEHYFRIFSTYLLEQCRFSSIHIDASYFNNRQLSYLSHDPNLYVNPILFV